jgi:phage repressor protein C with HTH and peptisase S24 domain
MSEPWERLRRARAAAGYETAAKAAEALGVKAAGYVHHENGSRPLTRRAQRYARFFRVSLEWLVSGRGPMRGNPLIIPVRGRVGAGAAVEFAHDAAEIAKGEWITVPDGGDIAALVVQGDSQWPRFLDREIVLYDPTPVAPGELVGHYAIVQTHDGRKLIKILRRSPGDNRWRLESHNAPAEEGVELIGAWRYLGVLPGR